MRTGKLKVHKSAVLVTGFVLVLSVGGLLAGCGSSREVDATSPSRATIRESFTEPARTRLQKTYRITMPVDGRIGRIELQPGDSVRAGQDLARIDRQPFELEVKEAQAAIEELEAEITLNEFDRIEETALIETQATVDAASDTLKAAAAQVEAERARHERADKQLARIERLTAQGTATEQQLDDARLEADTALIELRKQEFVHSALNAVFTAVQLGPKYISQWLSRKRLQRSVLYRQLDQARARLDRAEYQLSLAQLQSPIDGIVLERFEEGGGPFPSGHPLLLLGNLQELEVIADVLTPDAMKLMPGSEVELDCATCSAPFAGHVKRIEPAGFTKLSSLGVEQQRVNAIVTLPDRPATLGVGFRLQARFFTATKEDALVVPRFSVLQATNKTYYVFLIQGGKLKRRSIELGLRNDLELEVVEGVHESDQIVSTPDATMNDGESVKVTSSPND